MTFFEINRAYLLLSILLAFIIPCIDLQFVDIDNHVSTGELLAIPAIANFNLAANDITAMPEASSFHTLTVIYWLMVCIFLTRSIYSILQILKLRQLDGVSENQNIRFFRADIAQPFAFFDMIFLPKQGVNALVLEHEKAHVLRHHWIDIMLVEIAGALLWFNPVMTFYRKSIKIQHEYEADAHAAANGNTSEYLECILQHLQLETYGGPIHQFYSKNIKQRIHMITRKKTSQKYTLLYAVAIPAMAFLLAAFSFRSSQVNALEQLLPADKGGDVVIIVDAGHGGNDAGVKGSGISEKEFVLAVAKQVQKLGEANNIKVILTRRTDEPISLEERVSIGQRYQADIFISLHSNFHPDNVAASGIECLLSEKNSRFQDSKQFADKLIQELGTLKGISVTGTKMADFYVLTNNSAPAVLLELGYLSNKSDHDFLADEKNQRLISEKIISAVVQYSKQ